jgi:hypothetical protein
MSGHSELDHGVGVLADELLGPVAGRVVPLHPVPVPVVLHCNQGILFILLRRRTVYIISDFRLQLSP